MDFFSNSYGSQTQSPYFSSRRSTYSARGTAKRRGIIRRRQLRVPIYKSLASKANDSVIVCRTVQRNVTTSADIGWGFGWSPTYLWVNGASDTAIPGAADITSLYDVCRVKKVECNIMFDFNGYEVSATGTVGLPIVYTAFDPTTNANPTQSSIQQMATTKINMIGDARDGNRVVRNIYPRLQQSQSGAVMIYQSNQWVETGSDIPYNGLALYVDMINISNPNRNAMFVFKIYYECKITK